MFSSRLGLTGFGIIRRWALNDQPREGTQAGKRQRD